MTKTRILSGIKPSGHLHLGNYFGAIKNWIRLQDEGKYDCFFMIADFHALTTAYEKNEINEDRLELAIDLIALGIDPQKSTLFVQSDVEEHAELHLIFSMITPLPWLERVPTYKGTIAELPDRDLNTYGFLGYPVLQAADILIYMADAVPVGKDQLPHLELTREIARRFNFMFGELFPEPKDLLTEIPTLLGTDKRKMSKSYNNTIALSLPPEEKTKKIMSMITDPDKKYKNDPGNPDICNVFSYHKIFNESETTEIDKTCRSGSLGCVNCKKNLAEKINSHFSDYMNKRNALVKDIKKVTNLLEAGNQKARIVSGETLKKAKKIMKFI